MVVAAHACKGAARLVLTRSIALAILLQKASGSRSRVRSMNSGSISGMYRSWMAASLSQDRKWSAGWMESAPDHRARRRRYADDGAENLVEVLRVGKPDPFADGLHRQGGAAQEQARQLDRCARRKRSMVMPKRIRKRAASQFGLTPTRRAMACVRQWRSGCSRSSIATRSRAASTRDDCASGSRAPPARRAVRAAPRRPRPRLQARCATAHAGRDACHAAAGIGCIAAEIAPRGTARPPLPAAKCTTQCQPFSARS